MGEIRWAIERPRIEEAPGGGFWLMHPSNSAILAYCDTAEEVNRAAAAVTGLPAAAAEPPAPFAGACVSCGAEPTAERGPDGFCWEYLEDVLVARRFVRTEEGDGHRLVIFEGEAEVAWEATDDPRVFCGSCGHTMPSPAVPGLEVDFR